MFRWVNKNAIGLGVIVSILPFVWSINTYFLDKRQAERNESFNNYQLLIQTISDGGKDEYASSQRALIYELRFYGDYKNFTCREIPRMKGMYKNADTLYELDLLFDELGCK